MIYITGDCHGDFEKMNWKHFPQRVEMTKDDYVIICGDFGLIWDVEPGRPYEKYVLEWLEECPFTTLFVDGNHENFDRLNVYPIEEWHGGKVHKINSSVIHLMRGQVYEIDGKKIFTFGGAGSHDIQDGILEKDDPDYLRKKFELDCRGALYRINHVSWWAEEMASAEEKAEGMRNLATHNNEVDFIITHCCASSTQALLSGGAFEVDAMTRYLEEIKSICSYKRWFFGHYHANGNVTDKDILLYEDIVRVN